MTKINVKDQLRIAMEAPSRFSAQAADLFTRQANIPEYDDSDDEIKNKSVVYQIKPTANPTKTSNKIGINLTQNKLKPTIGIREESGKNLEGIRKESGNNQGVVREESGKNQEGIRYVNREESGKSIREESGKNQGRISFSRLVGKERALVLIIYDFCLETRSNITHEITREHLANYLKSSKDVAKVTMYSLIKKQIIIRYDFKDGPGGWTKYSLPDDIYHQIREYKNYSNQGGIREESGKNPVYTPVCRPGGISPSSSSININNNKTTTVLPDAWNFDLSDYEVFGFSKESLLQVYERQPNMPVEIIQDSLENFLWHHQRNNFPIFKKSPYEVLMGCLLKGLKFRSEARKKEIDSQARVEEKELQEELERASKLKFQKWVINKTDSEIEKYLSTQLIITLRSKGRAQVDVMSALYTYWLKN